jgi:hypothetical protein
MPVTIGNKKLIPAPFVNIQKQITFASDGSPLNSSYNLSIEGTILPNRGSPGSLGWHTTAGEPDNESFSTEEEKFNSILRKQEYIREALSATGWKFSYSAPGLEPVECYPKLTNITFAPGSWIVLCTYSATLEAPIVTKANTEADLIDYPSGYYGLNLSSVQDDYSVRESDDGRNILEIGRNLSATASFSSGPSGSVPPWQNARTWVQRRKNDVPFGTGFVTVSTLVGSGYNVIEEESINQLGGQYSLTQRFTYNPTNYIETRTVSRSFQRNRLGDGGSDVTNISVNGNIVGLHPTNDPSGKFAAASGYWATLYPLLPTLVGAVGQSVTENVNLNHQAGTIDYDIQYVNNSGIYYKHSYDVNYVIGADLPQVTINGSIEGYTPDDNYSGGGANFTKFDNAIRGWNAVSGIIKDLAFAYAASGLTGPSGLYSSSPLTKNISFNKANGTIGYNYVYAYTSGAANTYQHAYTIDLSTDNAPANAAYGGLLCTVTMNGQILGLSDSLNPADKLANAKTGWNSVRSTLYSLANSEYSVLGTNMPTLASGMARKTVTLDQKAGNLTYSVLFNNNPPAYNSGVAVEDVSVEDINPQDIHAIQLIPGRLAGPIIQNIGTVSERRRNINISLTMFPKANAPYYYTYSDKSIPATIASGLATGFLPAGIRGSGYWFAGDTETWQYKGGLYTRTINIVY